MHTLTATAGCVESGLQASASTCGSSELMRRGATTDSDGEADALVAGLPEGDALALLDGDGRMGLRLTGSITAPWSGRDTAAMEPSALKATGPSSGPGFSGK